MTSWGKGCADPDFPGVYVRLGAPQLNSWVVGPRPTASFTAAGQNLGPTVTLTSTSANTEGGTFDSLLWDLDADGQYDDASGAIVSHTFLTSGTVQVGLLASKTFGDWASTRQTIRINRPPSASAGQSAYSVPEGRSIALAATATDPDGDALDYRWDLNGDGTFESTGQTTTFTALGLDGPVTRAATVRVCDFFGACVKATAPRSRHERAAAGERRTGQAGETEATPLVPHARDGSRTRSSEGPLALRRRPPRIRRARHPPVQAARSLYGHRDRDRRRRRARDRPGQSQGDEAVSRTAAAKSS